MTPRGSTIATGTTETTLSPALPTGTVTGDLLVAIVGFLDGGSNATVVNDEAGWTHILAASGDNPRVYLRAFWKIAGASESAPVFDLSQTPSNLPGSAAFLIAFDGTLADVVLSSSSEVDSTDPYNIPGMTISQQDMYLLYSFGFGRGSTSVTNPPSGTTTLQSHNGADYFSALWGKEMLAQTDPPAVNFSMNNGSRAVSIGIAVGYSAPLGAPLSQAIIII